MKIETFGDKNNDCILLMHPMFLSGECFKNHLSKLTNYFVVIPTFSGHADAGKFESTYKEANDLCDYLNHIGVTKVKAAVGLSLGSMVAMHMYNYNFIPVEFFFLDGATVAPLKFRDKIKLRRNFLIMGKIFNAFPDIEIPEKLSFHFGRFFNIALDASKEITATDIKNMIGEYINYRLPKHLPDDRGKRLNFLFGSEEASCKVSLPIIEQKFPLAKVKVYKNMGHLGYAMNNEEEYSQLFLHIINNRESKYNID
ncbi:MAG: alpha/beta hydrolase [Clostridia bacterium]|nr:alpha/beta hydrolase [Clostridia bacterium]